MKHILAILLLTLSAVAARSQSTQAIYTRTDSLTIVRLLQKHTGTALPITPLTFAKEFIGVPYVAHTLEAGDDKRLVVNTRELDCTTLVETAAALTICANNGKQTFDEYLEVLQKLRYRGGKIDGYASRLHYFSDWIADNTSLGLVKEISGNKAPFTATQHINVFYMSRHPNSYKALKADKSLVEEIRKTEKALNSYCRYIPKKRLRNAVALQSYIKDGDILALTTNKAGLDIAHLGIAVWHKGELHLLNASMIHKKVIDEPMTLYRYMQEHPTQTGVRVIRIN